MSIIQLQRRHLLQDGKSNEITEEFRNVFVNVDRIAYFESTAEEAFTIVTMTQAEPIVVKDTVWSIWRLIDE